MKGQAQNLSRKQRIVLLLFGCVCCAVGMGLLVGIMRDGLYGYWRTRDKVTVAAQLQSVEFRTWGGGRGGTTSSTVVRYSYNVEGQSFTGSRVSIFKSSSRFYEQLSLAFRTDTPVMVFIDPREPHFAVIDRDFVWWPFIVAVPFSLVFTVIGLLIFWHFLRSFRK